MRKYATTWQLDKPVLDIGYLILSLFLLVCASTSHNQRICNIAHNASLYFSNVVRVGSVLFYLYFFLHSLSDLYALYAYYSITVLLARQYSIMHWMS